MAVWLKSDKNWRRFIGRHKNYTFVICLYNGQKLCYLQGTSWGRRKNWLSIHDSHAQICWAKRSRKKWQRLLHSSLFLVVTQNMLVAVYQSFGTVLKMTPIGCPKSREANKKVKNVKCSRYRPGVAQRVGRGVALFFHDRGTRRGWVVSSTSRPHFTPGEGPGTHSTGGWVGPRAGLDGQKILSPPGFDPGPSNP